MTGKLKRNILIFFIGIFLIGAITGYMMWNKPHLDVKDSGALKITAIDLYTIFTTDSVNARAKYLNKVVAVSGEIKEISFNQQHQQIVFLKTHTPDASVNCTMEENINNVKPGATILIKGICSGYIGGDADMGLAGDIFLIRCYPSN